MTIQLSHVEYSSAAEMLAAYADRRRRLMTVKVPSPQTKKVARVTDPAEKPMWKTKRMFFNAHIIAWQMHRAAQAMSPIPMFIAKWCEEHGTTPALMLGQCRKHPTAQLRHRLIFEIHSNFKVSLPQLGRMFGDRDHTTILNSLKKANAVRPPVSYEKAPEISADYRAGLSIARISEKHGISTRQVGRVIKEFGLVRKVRG